MGADASNKFNESSNLFRSLTASDSTLCRYELKGNLQKLISLILNLTYLAKQSSQIKEFDFYINLYFGILKVVLKPT